MTGNSGVIFRADGSKDLGLGHIVRSLMLASALKIELGGDVAEYPISFAIRDDEGARNAVHGSEFEQDITWLPWEGDIISHFRDIVHERQPRVVVTDINLTGIVDEYLSAIHPHAAHVSLQERNYHQLSGTRVIAPTVKPVEMASGGTLNVTHFTGADYVLLSPDIVKLRETAPGPAAIVNTVLVTLGGGDPRRLTEKVLTAIHNCGREGMHWKVVLGPASEYDKLDLIPRFPSSVEYIDGGKLGRDAFLEMLATADAVITNGGTTLYEALALGRPVLGVPQGDFEAEVLSILSDQVACMRPKDMTVKSITEVLDSFLEYELLRKSIAEKGKELIDGRGAMRVANLIISLLKK